MGIPRTPKDVKFCQSWLEHFDKKRAWVEAGWKWNSNSGLRALDKLQRFEAYLRPFQEAKAQALGAQLALDQGQVLQAMSKKAFFNPLDFIERTQVPLTREVKSKEEGGAEKITLEPVLWDGKPVYGERLKPYSELTAEQAAAVEVLGAVGEVVRYRLPSIREQHTYLKTLGQQFGMFLDKLILERHNHEHRHAHLHFDNVPTDKITLVRQQLLTMVAPEFAQSLGFSAEEVQAAQVEGGVLMPEKVA